MLNFAQIVFLLRLLVIDNYDSFTYNLVHIVEHLLHAKVDVCRNDEVIMQEIGRYDKLILSPGPGLPRSAGKMMEVIEVCAHTHSILGVCLGHQAIGEVFGARLKNLSKVYHGVSTEIRVLDKQDIFRGMPDTISAGRYHSWVVDRATLPESLKVTALDEDGNIMAMRHESLDISSVQFHPESVMTPEGPEIIRNWLFRGMAEI